jgi:hypothetical protein
MPRLTAPSFARLLGLGLLVLLGACAQQREPGYYDTPRGSTASDALQRAQGESGAVAPAQLQLGFGNQQTAPAAAPARPAAQAGAAGGAPQAAATAARRDVPQALADTRTYLGTIACTDGGACAATRMTLTLAPDGQWRARNVPVDGSGAARTSLGCWFLTGTDPIRIVLQADGQAYASLELSQSNVLRVTRLNGQVPLLESRLTRQADLDPIDELSGKPAQDCAAH